MLHAALDTRLDRDYPDLPHDYATDVDMLLAEVKRLRGLVQREHDARLEVHREAETLLRERDASEATNAELRRVGAEQADMLARLTGRNIERLEAQNAALRQVIDDVQEFVVLHFFDMRCGREVDALINERMKAFDTSE